MSPPKPKNLREVIGIELTIGPMSTMHNRLTESIENFLSTKIQEAIDNDPGDGAVLAAFYLDIIKERKVS